MRELHPKLVIQRLKESFKAVFGGDGTNQQFIEVFVTILSFALVIVWLFMLIKQ